MYAYLITETEEGEGIGHEWGFEFGPLAKYSLVCNVLFYFLLLFSTFYLSFYFKFQ